MFLYEVFADSGAPQVLEGVAYAGTFVVVVMKHPIDKHRGPLFART